MVRRQTLANEIFLDSSYAIALAASSDQLHLKAVKLAEEIESLGQRIITTRAVLLEIGNALSNSVIVPPLESYCRP
jgi:uncharacterized protein